MSRSKELIAAARGVSRAKQELLAARQRLAKLSTPSSAPMYAHGWHSWADRMLQANADKLRRIRGVKGFGIGYRVKSGRQTLEPCAIVYVQKKWSSTQLKKKGRASIPRSLHTNGKSLAVDVMEFKDFKYLSGPSIEVGDSLGPAQALKGTIGAFANESDTGKVVAVTAMHVSGLTVFQPGTGGCRFYVPSRYDSPNGSPLGDLLAGSLAGIDAAKIAIDDPSVVSSYMKQYGPIRGWRPVTDPGDRNTTVWMYGATSGIQTGAIIHPRLTLTLPQIDDAILVKLKAAEGDSGAAIVDSLGFVLGFLAGKGIIQGQEMCVFSPVASVLNQLSCDSIIEG